MNLRIELIKNHPSAISTLALLWHEMLGKLWEPDVSIKSIEAWFYEWLNDSIPLAFVALDDEKPIGMCSLQMNDGIPSDLMPWLGDLCVDHAYQNRGVARKLIETAEENAKAQGFDALYLLALDANMLNYYQRFNWIIIGMDNYKGHPVTIMKKIL